MAKIFGHTDLPPSAAPVITFGVLTSPVGRRAHRLFNDQAVGGRKWSDNTIRKLYSRERFVGREVFRTTRQDRNRQTGKIRYVKFPQDQWLVRESPNRQGGSNGPNSLPKSPAKPNRGGAENSPVDSETPRQPREARRLSLSLIHI